MNENEQGPASSRDEDRGCSMLELKEVRHNEISAFAAWYAGGEFDIDPALDQGSDRASA